MSADNDVEAGRMNPTKPDIDYSYAGFQQEQQDNPFPGTQLDNDLAELSTSIDETIDALADVRRADGALQNSIVTADSLDESLLIGLKTPSIWVTSTRYVVLDTVIANTGIYRCLVSHESGDFDDDYMAGYWQLIFELSPLVPANLPSYQFTGDGETIDWPVGLNPGTPNNIVVSAGGSFQLAQDIALIIGPTNYVRISPAVPDGVKIEIRTLVATAALNIPADGSVGISQLDAEVVALVELAETALQPADIGGSVQAYDVDLTAIAALTTAADKLPYATGAGTWGLADITAAGRALLDDANATAQRVTLGLVIGTDVQASDADLTAIAALVSAADRVPYATGAGTWSLATLTSFGRSLIDDVDAAAARTTLGLSTGTYTPTLTNTTNIAASTAYVCQWMRVNNVVTVSGKVDIDATAAGNALLGMSLPVASALTTDIQLGGTFVSNAATTPEAGCIFADGTNDRASLKHIAVNTANNTFFFSFTYLVL